ncbi:MAG TPA: NTP transferase domain-containing protein [Agromyces sp.]
MIDVAAVVLMGGRASRLGGIVKGDLVVDGRTLLERAVAAGAVVAREVVVVGEPGRSRLPAGIRVVREEPPFGGPAAAVAAGVQSLTGDASAVLLLAGDLPFAADAVPGLVEEFVGGEAAGTGGADPGGTAGGARAAGVRAVDDSGRAQHLLCIVRRDALDRAIVALAAHGPIDGASMRALLAPLRFTDLAVPKAAKMDVDPWAVARAVGATRGETS